MIKPDEIMLGNYFAFGRYKIPQKLKLRDLRRMLCGEKRFEPIPITEEWLLRLGFEKDIDTKTWSILTSLEKFDYLFEIENKYQKYYQPDFMRIDLKYVHQLQNLYFALTGEKLTIKENK